MEKADIFLKPERPLCPRCNKNKIEVMVLESPVLFLCKSCADKEKAEPDYGPCEYCSEPARYWHKIGAIVCEKHFEFSLDEICELESTEERKQWEKANPGR